MGLSDTLYICRRVQTFEILFFFVGGWGWGLGFIKMKINL